MIFLKFLGAKADVSLGKKSREKLTDVCESFLRGGGHLDVLQWLALGEVEQIALLEAGNRIKVDEAQTIAEAVVTRLLGSEEDQLMAAARKAAQKREKKGAA